MLYLFLSFLGSTCVLYLCAHLLPGLEVENHFQLFLGALILSFLNFVITPALIGLRLQIKLSTLGIIAFLLNLLVLNITLGLMDEFDFSSWTATIFGAVLLGVIQVVLDLADEERRKIIT